MRRRIAIVLIVSAIAFGCVMVWQSRSRIPADLPAPAWVQKYELVGTTTWPMAEKTAIARSDYYTVKAPIDEVLAVADSNLDPSDWHFKKQLDEWVYTWGKPMPSNFPNWLVFERQEPWYRIVIKQGHAVITHGGTVPSEKEPWTTIVYETGGRTPPIYQRITFDSFHLGNPKTDSIFVRYAPAR